MADFMVKYSRTLLLQAPLGQPKVFLIKVGVLISGIVLYHLCSRDRLCVVSQLKEKSSSLGTPVTEGLHYGDGATASQQTEALKTMFVRLYCCVLYMSKTYSYVDAYGILYRISSIWRLSSTFCCKGSYVNSPYV